MSSRRASSTPTARGEITRSLILETALRLFRERGYEGTTMRAVADAAGVSLGNAYYYFATKEQITQAYYLRAHEEHVAKCAEILEKERDFGARLRGVLMAKVDVSDPHHRFAGQLFRTAADPESPLNPFSPQSQGVRDQAIAVMGQVALGSRTRIPADLAQDLPYLLWLHEMGVILFWIHDKSENRRRTRRLVERTSDIVSLLVKLASNPLLAPLRKLALSLVRELRGEAP